MERKKLIYGLVDPNTSLIRYIGKSSSGLHRPKSHYRLSFKKMESGTWVADYHVNRWIRSMNTPPLIEVLETFTDMVARNEIDEAEISWISFFRYIGRDLTNMHPGGTGGALKGNLNPFFGKKHSDQTLEKLRRQSGKNHPMYGKPGTFKGRKHKESSKEKMRKSHIGLQAGSKHGMYGKHHDSQTLEKLSKKIICVTDGRKFRSLKSAAEFYNISPSAISAIITGRNKSMRSGLFFKLDKA